MYTLKDGRFPGSNHSDPKDIFGPPINEKEKKLVLIIDDTPSHRREIRTILTQANLPEDSIEDTATIDDAKKRLGRYEFRFIFCDLLVASEKDRTRFNLDENPANAASMPPRL